MNVRRATPGDAPSIVELMREGFGDDLLSLTVYGCRGITDFVASELALPPEDASHQFIVVEADGDIVGFIESVRQATSTLLSYAAVRPDHQGRRIGTTLFREAVAAAERDGRQDIVLDVIDTNRRAADWYARLGFVPQDCKGWWLLRVPDGFAGDAVIVDYPQAEAAQKRFGFSELHVQTGAGVATIGRLGDHRLRITDPAVLENGAAWSAVRAIEPARTGLLVRAPLLGVHGESPLMTTTRMASTATAVLPNLVA